VQPSAEVLVDRIATVLRQRLPPGVTPAYFEGFLLRNRPALVAVLDRQLAARSTRYPPGTEWTASSWRTSAERRSGVGRGGGVRRTSTGWWCGLRPRSRGC
jgi:hypothetical protein